MASGMASGVAVSCINGMIGKTAFGAFGGTATKLKLMSTAANEGADGTEISGGSYPAGGISATVSTTFGAGSYALGVATITNSGAAISQSNMPTVVSPGVVSASLWDTGTTPVRWWWGDLTTGVATNLGDTLTFNTSSVTIQLNV
jgi:hypothetical protein